LFTVNKSTEKREIIQIGTHAELKIVQFGTQANPKIIQIGTQAELIIK
jgi:hypothetical protein